MFKNHETVKHNYDCNGDCRYNLQCAIDAAWQELEECLLHEEGRVKE
jgi:hypothetical protein